MKTCKSFRFSTGDMELIEEWKEALRFKTYIEVVRYALRRLGAPETKKENVISLD